jgi:hypothetical protein
MNTKINTPKLIVIVLLYTIYVRGLKGYVGYLPTIPVYPNNQTDVEVMKKIMESRTHEDVDLFYKTNESVAYAFLPYVNEPLIHLSDVATSQNATIIFFKRLINRRRPYQIDPHIYPLSTLTSQTPSYPAGHAYQALVLASYLTKKYPDKKHVFDSIALKCDECRVKAGIHYKSDGEFSQKLFQLFN